jgi:hypothetical protein
MRCSFTTASRQWGWLVSSCFSVQGALASDSDGPHCSRVAMALALPAYQQAHRRVDTGNRQAWQQVCHRQLSQQNAPLSKVGLKQELVMSLLLGLLLHPPGGISHAVQAGVHETAVLTCGRSPGSAMMLSVHWWGCSWDSATDRAISAMQSCTSTLQQHMTSASQQSLLSYECTSAGSGC